MPLHFSPTIFQTYRQKAYWVDVVNSKVVPLDGSIAPAMQNIPLVLIRSPRPFLRKKNTEKRQQDTKLQNISAIIWLLIARDGFGSLVYGSGL